MKTIFDERHRDGILARVEQVTADSRPRWGKMNVEMMLAHLVASMRMATGELPTKSKKLPIRFPPLRQLLVYWLPWPKGTPTAPELLPSDRGSVDDNKRALAELIRATGAKGPRGTWPEHPAFGNLSGRGWGVLAWRHIDHHLRQFGV
ncbi:MAG TPA: DUF1569 domain-containing protein [Thermoanaerobaculia bacterium]|nr:DUF1569 domain-containing protein [Thermoanaerobaculia bacterium]